MAEPTSTTVAALAASLSGVTLALFGVDYYSLLYGMVGSLFAVVHAGKSTPDLSDEKKDVMSMIARIQARILGSGRVVMYVAFSTLGGAVFGNAAVAVLSGNNRSLLILGCLIGGAGAHLLVTACLNAALARIKRFGDGS
jgi:hypothetical protein